MAFVHKSALVPSDKPYWGNDVYLDNDVIEVMALASLVILYGVLCFSIGVVIGAYVIPWSVDRAEEIRDDIKRFRGPRVR